ncbi:MAG: Na+/H+ antiporter [Candidatus Obscuribacter sp.]|nr:Na+/H+ antiporter [Candidatus Obscuribacter sp.]MBK9277379.1 Na+/H+ antiporter [Candidatus Obscuribacter sp.]
MAETIHIDIFVVLLLVTASVAITVKWIKLPYSIALVIVGLCIGLFHLLPPVEMTPELILLIFLPSILFEASWNIRLAELQESWKSITILATIGVVINTLLVAYGMHFLANVALGPAFLFGAMIAATDPISVLALFRKLGIDSKLTTILEGESLFNDGTAVVLFKLVLACVISQSQFSIGATTGSFLLVVLGGGATGALIGYGASQITRLFDDHLLEITLTTIVAYGSYLVAEQLHVSAVLSVVTAGIVLGNYGSRTGMSPATRMAVNSFWEYLAFLVNSLIFLLIGLQVKFGLLLKYSVQIGVGVLVVLLARLAVVYGLAPLIGMAENKLPWKWRHLLFWGALRGSVCMALALSLPEAFPYKEMITITTFGVVLFTLLIPGLTIEPLVSLLKMNAKDPKQEQYRTLRAQLITKKRALEFLANQLKTGSISASSHERLHAELNAEKEALTKQINDLQLEDTSIKALEEEELRHRIYVLEKDSLKELVKDGVLTEESLRKVELEARYFPEEES